jgi:hypothetical protein
VAEVLAGRVGAGVVGQVLAAGERDVVLARAGNRRMLTPHTNCFQAVVFARGFGCTWAIDLHLGENR